MDFHVRLGVFPMVATAMVHFPLKSAPPAQPTISQRFFSAVLPAQSVVRRLTGLVVLIDFFFNSLVVRVPCSLIFWRFWLFSDFRLVVIRLLVVRGSKGFLPTPPSWLELQIDIFNRASW